MKKPAYAGIMGSCALRADYALIILSVEMNITIAKRRISRRNKPDLDFCNI